MTSYTSFDDQTSYHINLRISPCIVLAIIVVDVIIVIVVVIVVVIAVVVVTAEPQGPVCRAEEGENVQRRAIVISYQRPSKAYYREGMEVRGCDPSCKDGGDDERVARTDGVDGGAMEVWTEQRL